MDLATQYIVGMKILLSVIIVCAIIWLLIFRNWILEIIYIAYEALVFLAVAVPLWFYVYR